MKKIISLLILTLFSCSPKINYIEGHKIIRYGTKEFEEFEKKAPIKKEQAWDIQYQEDKKQQVAMTKWLFFVIDKDYIFTGVMRPKNMETELLGHSVNSETGEVKWIDKNIMIKYENAFTLNKDKPFSYPLKKKYRKENKMPSKN